VIVFFGNAQRMGQYAATRGLKPGRDIVRFTVGVEALRGRTEHIEAVVDGSYPTHETAQAHAVFDYIGAINRLHEKEPV